MSTGHAAQHTKELQASNVSIHLHCEDLTPGGSLKWRPSSTPDSPTNPMLSTGIRAWHHDHGASLISPQYIHTDLYVYSWILLLAGGKPIGSRVDYWGEEQQGDWEDRLYYNFMPLSSLSIFSFNNMLQIAHRSQKMVVKDHPSRSLAIVDCITTISTMFS